MPTSRMQPTKAAGQVADRRAAPESAGRFDRVTGRMMGRVTVRASGGPGPRAGAP